MQEAKVPEIQITEISNHNDLPKGTEMLLYEPPFVEGYDSDMDEIVAKYTKKYGYMPVEMYRLNHQIFVLLPEVVRARTK